MYHKIVLVGHLGGDPEMRYTPSGVAVTNFSVATNRVYSKDGERVEETTWFRISAWNRLAEICQEYLKKGSAVLVDGELQGVNGNPRIWTGDDGEPRASYEVRANTIKFLSGKKQDDGIPPF